MAMWEEVVSDVSSMLQFVGALGLLRVADELLCVRSCSLECAMLKHSTTTTTSTASIGSGAANQQDVDAEMAMGALGIGAANLQPTIDAAIDLVDFYNSSSVFRRLRSGRRIKSDMEEMRRRVTDYHDLLLYIHAGVAISSATHAAAAQT